jgi:hypothetical protein
MSVHRPERCPTCGSTEFDELFRLEARELGGRDNEVAVYHCSDPECQAEFDSVPPRD